MNSKMATNSQLSTTEPKNKNKNKTKQTTRPGTESQKWRSHGGLSVWGGGKVQGIISLNGRNKIDRGRLRTVQEIEKPKNYMYDPWT